ncbi:MAG: AAA family ATPase [Sulfurovum sp.]|nr:AAA family ATPase [Sulfurovum sp.]
MELQLKNIGMIKEANVKINGLTVIAGENDTGKSTVGKIIFCIIKATSRYKEDFNESKIYKIENKLDGLFFYIRRNIDFIDEDNEEYYDKLKNILSMNSYLAYVDNEIAYVDYEKSSDYMRNLDDHLKPLKSMIEKHDKNAIKYINNALEELKFIINTPENKNKSIENALNKVFRSEFDSNIVSFNEDIGFIKLIENNLTLLDLKIVSNKIEIINNCEPIEFDEVTFIETPLILNNHDMLIRSQTGLDINKRGSRRLGVPYTTLHTKDLFDKLKSNGFGFFLENDFEEQLENDFEEQLKNNIQDFINGEIIYDIEERDFVYIKNNQKIPIKNTATGIKSFGIIQLLIDNDFINRNSVLILDEPEIHIHPKWQLKYAQLISVLVDNAVPVIVTSHSPYMIEALKRYTDRRNLQGKTNFYLADNSIVEDKNKLYEIYEKLSEPFDEFDKMDSDILNGK